MSTPTPTERALLLCAYALRLNTTNPQSDREWPTDPYRVEAMVLDALREISPVDPTVCAAMVILDESNTDPVLADQDELLTRFERLAGGAYRSPLAR